MTINDILTRLLLTALMLFSGLVSSMTLDEQRTDFLLAETLIEQKKDVDFLALSATLQDYPLYPYLQYQWLKSNLTNTEQVVKFLSTFSNSRYADLLRKKWLTMLSNQQRWQEYIKYYQPDNDVSGQCRYLAALYKSGQQQPALNKARNLWSSNTDLPAECTELLSALIAGNFLNQDFIWTRFQTALINDKPQLAYLLQTYLTDPQKLQAQIWFKVHGKPLMITESGFLTPAQGMLFAHGINRLAHSQLDLALNEWDNRKQLFAINPEISQKTERKLALALAKKPDPRAFDRLNHLLLQDEDTKEWLLRTALLEQNWQHLGIATATADKQEQNEPKWQYWHARALLQRGDALQAYIIFNKLAEDRSFYGFLAADMANKPYNFMNHPVALKDDALALLAKQPDFKVIEELNFHKRDLEAQRQWWYAIERLPKDQMMIAAKLAQLWQWDQNAIITLVKADYWDDLDLRFPLRYQSEVKSNASLQQLDPAIVYGVMRQESMLDKNARSESGALGLMQLMPKTAKRVASDLKDNWQGEKSLHNPEVNIKYGSYYYKQLLNRFNNHFALATAAYNAGPNRANKWLPVDKPVAADIWIETIPFKETRKYVSSVLSYAIIYQQQMGSGNLRLKNLMQDVKPVALPVDYY